MENIPEYEEFLKQIKFNLWLAGIPYGDPKINFRFFAIYTQLSLMLVFEISFFVSRISAENFLELTQLAPCLGIGILTEMKTVAIAQKRMKIYDLTENLKKLYQNIVRDKKKMKVVKKDLMLLNLLMKYYVILNAVLITVYNFATPFIIMYHYFTTNEVIYKLPYAVLVPFSTEAWLPWTFIYVHSVICGFICVLFYTTVDGLYFVLTSHVCANFSVISDMIESLDKTTVDRLADIVKEHQYISKLAEDLEDIYTAPNLFNVLVGSLEICALGFNLTTGSWEHIPGYFLFLLSVLLQIFMMSVFGEDMIRESKKIGDAAYLCKWYEMDEKSKKTILTIMISATILLNLVDKAGSTSPPRNHSSDTAVVQFNSVLESDLNAEHDASHPRTQRNPFRCYGFAVEMNHRGIDGDYLMSSVSVLCILGTFLLNQSKKPQQLTAYQFSTISYGSFTKIISTSWSYFTILRTVYTPPEASHSE